MKRLAAFLWATFVSLLLLHPAYAGNYKNFIVSTYITQGTMTQLMNGQLDPAASFDYLNQRLKIDKIYLEVMRNQTLVDEAGLDRLKKFFQDRGVEVAGGLAMSVSESNGYQGFDYADPADRAFAKQSAELAARHFDEILLDDYFFFDRKSDFDIKAKGDKTWTQFRLEMMRDAAENLIVKPAKAVNPNVKVIIKYANWYDQYHGMGNDTEKEPLIADGIYSGTESRTWVGQEQHMMPYQSYGIMRFMDNLQPGINKGGWVDRGGSVPIDRYAEELWDTVFARCPEITCFNYPGMLGGISPQSLKDRTWADQPTSFNYDAMVKSAGEHADNPGFARVAGYSLEQVDAFLGRMGKPTGVKSYTPYHAAGEEFLHDYIGMIGVPMDVFPTFPTDADMVFLTEQAKLDPDIVSKIKGQLVAGKSVCITSGLLRALKGKGIEDICEMEVTGNQIPVRRFTGAAGPGAVRRGDPAVSAERDILIPEIKYLNILTHDAWGDLSGVSPGGITYPMLLSCDYSKGKLYVLTIPSDPADLYALPISALGVIRTTLARDEPIRIESAPAQVALFRYDNNTFIVQNYLPVAAEVSVSIVGGSTQIHDLVAGNDYPGKPARRFTGTRPTTFPASLGGFPMPTTAPARLAGTNEIPRMTFSFTVLPHSYQAFEARP